jgi:alcohol dehydrogenase, propanol-preferring
VLTPGTSALIIGAGGLGQYGVQFVKLLSAANMIVADTSAAKRTSALALGADVAVDPNDPDAADQIRSAAGGEGVAAVLDFVGVDATMALGTAALARQGTFVLLGLAGGTTNYSFLSSAMESRLMTSNWGTRDDLDEVLAVAAAGRLVHRLERHPLDAINDVFARLANGDIDGRAVLTP